MNPSNSAAGAVQLSSQSDVPTSPAIASQMPRYGAEPERVPAISKAQAGGHCVTRRTVMNLIVSSAAVVAAGVGPKTTIEGVPLDSAGDEIFRLITEHKRASAEFAYAVSDANLLPGQISPDPDVEDHYSGLEEEARYALLETIPSSLPGAIALLDYVEGLGTGRSNPRGLSDNAFDDNLLDVISSALECLRDHVL